MEQISNHLMFKVETVKKEIHFDKGGINEIKQETGWKEETSREYYSMDRSEDLFKEDLSLKPVVRDTFSSSFSIEDATVLNEELSDEEVTFDDVIQRYNTVNNDETYEENRQFEMRPKFGYEASSLIQVFKCFFANCNKIFTTHDMLKTHQHKDHFPPEERSFEADKFKCCGKLYSNKESLRKHKSNHKRFLCPVEGCDRNNLTTYRLKLHLNRHAKGLYHKQSSLPDQTIPCSHCNKSFVTMSGLHRHISVSHLLFACIHPRCGQKFINSLALKIHKVQHDS